MSQNGLRRFLPIPQNQMHLFSLSSFAKCANETSSQEPPSQKTSLEDTRAAPGFFTKRSMRDVSEVSGTQSDRQIPEPEKLAGIRKEMERASRQPADGPPEGTGGKKGAGTKPPSTMNSPMEDAPMEKSAWMGAPVTSDSRLNAEARAASSGETVDKAPSKASADGEDSEGEGPIGEDSNKGDQEHLDEKLSAACRDLAGGQVPEEQDSSSTRAVRNASAEEENGEVIREDRRSSSWIGAPVPTESLEVDYKPTRRQDSAEDRGSAEIQRSESSVAPKERRSISIPSHLLATLISRAQGTCEGHHTGVSDADMSHAGEEIGGSKEAHRRSAALLLEGSPQERIGEKMPEGQACKISPKTNPPRGEKNGRESVRGPPEWGSPEPTCLASSIRLTPLVGYVRPVSIQIDIVLKENRA